MNLPLKWNHRCSKIYQKGCLRVPTTSLLICLIWIEFLLGVTTKIASNKILRTKCGAFHFPQLLYSRFLFVRCNCHVALILDLTMDAPSVESNVILRLFLRTAFICLRTPSRICKELIYSVGQSNPSLTVFFFIYDLVCLVLAFQKFIELITYGSLQSVEVAHQ